jgi:hypothetical protein
MVNIDQFAVIFLPSVNQATFTPHHYWKILFKTNHQMQSKRFRPSKPRQKQLSSPNANP